MTLIIGVTLAKRDHHIAIVIVSYIAILCPPLPARIGVLTALALLVTAGDLAITYPGMWDV
ncbi:MAG: hypothetical protein MJE77_41455 [Proteobacteria bacterium]|nr:hypothetical protein [Pseudomonadota bacterium]